MVFFNNELIAFVNTTLELSNQVLYETHGTRSDLVITTFFGFNQNITFIDNY